MYDTLIANLRKSADLMRKVRQSLYMDWDEQQLRQAADAIEELQKPRWIPVTERLPEMGKEVLVSDKQKRVTIAWIVGCFSKDGASFEWACSDGWIDDQLPITHWQPLPEPPKEG